MEILEFEAKFHLMRCSNMMLSSYTADAPTQAEQESILTPEQPRVRIAMTIQSSTQKSERAPGQAYDDLEVGRSQHMEHIVNSETEGIDFTRYSAYIASIRDDVPPHVYSFASDPRYFDLSSHSSLHDSWLESLTVREVASGERKEIRRMEVAISLLGSFHDRRIHLHYSGVTCYTFSAPPHYGVPRFDHTAHGDLFTHEIRIGHDGLVIHELLFENDATFLIEFSDFTHAEEIITNETEQAAP